MSKQGGLGDNFYVGGYDLSGDTSALSKISGSIKTLDTTGINKLAHERIGGERDAGMDFTVFWNSLGAHIPLSALPTGDVQASYRNGTLLGNPAAEMVAKQLNYDPTRGNDGALTATVSLVSNGFGLEWGQQLTAGLRTDTAATNGTSIDTTASASFGGQAYLQVTAFTGTDVTVKIQDSADNVTFADVSGLTFAQTTAAPTTQRIATAALGTLRRYLRAATVTTGGVTSVTFAVTVVKNQNAQVIF